MTQTRRITAVASTALVLAACGSTSADTIGLHYGKGPIEGEHFEGMVESGSGSLWIGPGDFIVRVPTNKRDYSFCADVRDDAGGEGCDGPPITVTALGGAEIAYSGVLSFVINTGSEQATQSFYEDLCRKFDACGEGGLKDDGWAELLRVNVRAPLEDTLQEVSREYTVDAIYAGTPSEDAEESEEEALSTLTQISDFTQRQMRDTVNDFAGGEFFCGPSFDRTASEGTEGEDDFVPPECPEMEFVITEVTPSAEVISAFNANIASRQGVIDATNDAQASGIAQDQENANTVSEAQAQAEAAQALAAIASIPGVADYLRAQAMATCAANTNCTLVIGDPGVNVNTGPRPQ